MKLRYAYLCIALLLLMAAPAALAQDAPVELTVVTHDSFAVSEELLLRFEEEFNITVRILRAGDTGTMVNQSVLTKNNPLGDVMYGVDNTFLTRALAADLFIPYQPQLLEDVSEEFVLDDLHRVTPIDYGDVCINFDVNFFEVNDVPLPTSLEALIDPSYSGLLVVENPATSSPGLAFLLATVDVFGTDGDYTFVDYWADLVANDVLVVESWTEAYYGQFSASSDGDRPLVVSYASSPAAEVYFSDTEIEVAPTDSLVESGMCFRQVEFAGILDGTENVEAAQQFIDFLLSVEFQQDMPLQMFVFPVNDNAELPEVFEEYARIPDNPTVFDIAVIDENRAEWINQWTETVLR